MAVFGTYIFSFRTLLLSALLVSTCAGADTLPNSGQEATLQLLAPTTESNGKSPVRLDFGEVPISSMGSLLTGGKHSLPPSSTAVTVALYLPSQIAPSDEKAIEDSLRRQFASRFRKVNISVTYRDIKRALAQNEERKKRIESILAQYPATSPEREVLAAAESTLDKDKAREASWAASFHALARWLGRPETANKVSWLVALYQGGTTFKTWITAPGAGTPSGVAQWLGGSLLDFACIKNQSSIARFLRTNQLPEGFPGAKYYNSSRAEVPKSYLWNLLLFAVGRAGYDKLMLHIRDPVHAISPFSGKFLTQIGAFALADLVFYSLSEKGYDRLYEKGYISEPARRYLLWGGGILYQLSLIGYATGNWHLMLGSAGLSWLWQSLVAAAGHYLPARRDRFVAVHPDLMSDRERIDQLEATRHAVKVPLTDCGFAQLAPPAH